MEIEVNPKQTPWPILGLTGNIACGKTLATDFFKTQGFEVLDADVMARDLVKVGTPALVEIQKAFGPSILLPDGTLNRPSLNALIFTHPEAKRTLEGILHPKILQLLEARIQTLLMQHPKPYIIFSAPLLFEGGLHRRCGKVMLIDCAPDLQIQRLHGRNGFTRSEALLRMHQQMPADQKRAKSDWVVENNLSPEVFINQLRQRVAEIKTHLNALLGNK